MAGVATWLQLLDAVIGLQYGDQFVCTSSLLQSSSVLSSLWAFVCLAGWFSSWDNLLFYISGSHQHMSMLAFASPVVSLAFIVDNACRLCRSALPTSVSQPLGVVFVTVCSALACLDC